MSEKTYRIQKYRISWVREKTEPERVTISNRNDVIAFICTYLHDRPFESCIFIALNASNKIIGFMTFEGSGNQCAVYPSQVFSFLTSCGATCFIMAHNHPGGTPSASEADWEITLRLKNAGKLLDLPLLDSVILAEDSTVSLRESLRWN